MKKLFLAIICFTLLIIVSSCGSGSYTVSIKGDKTEIELKNGNSFTAEMIFISDTAIVFASIVNNSSDIPRLFYSLNTEIKSISVKGYDGSGWLPSVLLFQVLPAGLMAGAAASVEDSDADPVTVGFICAIPAILTSILFATTEGDTPKWNNNLSTGLLDSLKIYSRYPDGLNQQDLDRLLEMYKQKEIKKLY